MQTDGMTTLHNIDRINIDWKLYVELESRIVKNHKSDRRLNSQLTLL
jgi:hypothetical protein